MAYSGNFSNGCSDCLKIVDVCMCACFCASAIFSDTSVSVHRLRVHSLYLCFLNRSIVKGTTRYTEKLKIAVKLFTSLLSFVAVPTWI